MAGYSAAIKLNNLVITSLTTVGNGISNFTSQNFGAQKLYRVKQGFKAGRKMVWMLCIPLVLLYWIAGRYLIYLFMKDINGAAVNTGVLFLRIVSPFYFVVAVKMVADGVLRGAGIMGSFMISTFTDLVLRVGLAWVLSIPLEATGIWCAWPIGWAIGMALSVAFYRRGPWRNAAEEKEGVQL